MLTLRRQAGVVGLGLLVAACGGAVEGACGPTTGRVVEVIDGDTLVLEGGERVRYLLADAPETTGGHADCFGAEARAFNRRLVEGRGVTLVDGEACEDRFGRRLAYVWVDGQEVNSLLVERGLACVLHVPPAGSARRAEFQALEVRARSARHGMWGACSPVACAR
ncbi:thermonuclease family protein [Myxococcus sp. K15C18031901]|uniref:thermonuclease family protein n=1 Tax=Myxococcus dinghuensis TaxID=2906761 RepID=UPI0020A821D4|nr:thermonuclease family protein [Myxococcus dinghuensis]MCP3098234.1 thermonuclease family protein [Myxococcus dinghuensis]